MAPNAPRVCEVSRLSDFRVPPGGELIMKPLVRLCLVGIASVMLVGVLPAQEKSVKPGINDSFRDPNVKEFQGRFEVESREVFARRKEILAACELKPGDVVADLGAGTGLFTRLFAEAVGEKGRVIAVDIARKFLDHIERTSREAGLRNVETQLCTADSAELPENSVDLVFICDTYHHFEYPLKTMASVRRALKPDGRVIVIDFHRIPGVSSEWTLNHVRAGQDVFVSEIVQSGFRKVKEPEGLLKENYFVEFSKSGSPGLKPLEFPLIAGYGGVVKVAKGQEHPQPGAKAVMDVTANSSPNEVNKGLERAARLINLYGAAGYKAADVKIAVVLHGEATKAALNDEFYSARFQTERNPSLPLIKALRNHGVEIFVCGQALNFKGFPESTVADDVSIADAALTVIIRKQTVGYTFVPVP
jgi:ubiquinone/menaquinone biosynthesis C-methylase UbiE/intracellular sulfur oxidation DsrE/DsrF family protein